jgi:AraC-like DNA-binding protein
VFLRTIRPHPEIAPFIHHFWVFGSPEGLPAGDARVVVPNGRHKLIVPYRNGLRARSAAAPESRAQHHGAGDPVVVGLWEEPSIIASSREETCTIGVELPPHGLVRFFPVEAHELTGRIVPLAEVLGRAGRELGARVAEAPSAERAVDLVQEFLRARLRDRAADPGPVDAALGLLARSDYAMEIGELERRMGYSRRYLHALFVRQVGLAPKRLAGVLAFERLYRRFAQERSVTQLKQDALEIFYDQSHFIRTFRRFTGFSPGKFAELDNEFGRIFYLPGPDRAPSR